VTAQPPPSPDRGGRSGDFSKFEWHRAFNETHGLSLAERCVGGVAFDRAHADGSGARISAATVAERTGITVRSAQRGIASMQSRGFLVRTFKGGRRGGRNLASEYTLQIPQYDTGVVVGTDSQYDSGDVLGASPNTTDATPNTTVGAPQYDTGVVPIDPLQHIQYQEEGSARATRETPDPFAQWSHLLRRDTRIHLNEIAGAIVNEDPQCPNGEGVVHELAQQLMEMYSESTRPQTTIGFAGWIQDMHSSDRADEPVVTSVHATLIKKAA
jgi:hypothetical protein